MVDRLSSSEKKEFEALSFLLKNRIGGWHRQPGVLIVHSEDKTGPTIVRQQEKKFNNINYPERARNMVTYYQTLADEIASLNGKSYVLVDYKRNVWKSDYLEDNAFNRLLSRQGIISPESWLLEEVVPVGIDTEVNEVSSLYFRFIE